MKVKEKKVIFFLLMFIFLFTCKISLVKAAGEEQKQILILSSYNHGLKWSDDVICGIEEKLKTHKNLDIHCEFMNSIKYSTPNYHENLYKSYKEKFRNFKFNLILCSDNQALQFLLKYKQDIFGDCPVVFCGVSNLNLDAIKKEDNYTGVIEKIYLKDTIDSIINLQPGIKKIAVLCDSTTIGTIDEKETKKIVNKYYKNKLKFFFYKDKTIKQFINETNQLGDNLAVLAIGQLRDENNKIVIYEKNNKLFKKINKPIYTCWDFYIGEAVIGGKVISGLYQGEICGQIANEILKGKNPKDIPIVNKTNGKYIFNYSKMLKYGIKMRRLPKDYYIINNPYNFYKLYKKTILGTFSIIILLIIFIIIISLNYKKIIEGQKKLKISEQRYKLSIDGSNDIIWNWNVQQREMFLSDNWTNLTCGKTIQMDRIENVISNLIYEKDIPNIYEQVEDHLNEKTQYFQVEVRINKNISKDEKWIYIRGKASKNSNNIVTNIAGSITDITDRKKSEEKIKLSACRDQLTGLINRRTVYDILSQELQNSKYINNMGAVFFIDLDNFKNINDTLGHDYGDELLKIISKRISSILTEDEVFARLGGDEFLVLKKYIKEKKEAENLAKKILNSFKESIYIDDKQIYSSCSIGITIYPKDGIEHNVLLKNADTAMYKAKEKGKNKYLFFNHNMFNELIRKNSLEKGLRHAIENDELKILYQPQIDINTNEIKGVETLLRWKSKEFGLISPNEFIPIAEDTFLIIPIGDWILKNVCFINKRWIDEGYKPITISVNISNVQLEQQNFVDKIRQILTKTKLPSKYLELEITESVMRKNVIQNLKTLVKIRKMGVKVSLDDFGTGYSSLSYLNKLPINQLKLDKSFVKEIDLNKRDTSIAHTVIQLAHKLKIDVIAEGVETQKQYEMLKDMNCDKIQGFYFDAPMEYDKFMKKYMKKL